MGAPLATRFRIFAFVLFLTIVGQAASRAQTVAGTILGTVKDQSGAVLPGAAVTATNIETGIARKTVSDSRGEYRIEALGLGQYQVTSDVTGFQTEVRSGITLTVGREAVVDFTLSIGSVSQQVTVTGEAPLIETTTATLSDLMDTKQIQDIPLNARDFLTLVPLQTGAVLNEDVAPSSQKGFGIKLSSSGGRYISNSFLLDGARINDATASTGSAAGGMPGVEAVREFKVVTNAYDAEYGQHTGAVVSVVTKSGTNAFHGSLFEFLRNSALDAPGFNNNSTLAGAKSPYRRNQFGGSVGGPVKKDKMFFFVDVEELRQSQGTASTYVMPGPLIRRGCVPNTSGTGIAQVRTSISCANPDGTTTTITDLVDPIPASAGFVAPNVAPFMNAYPFGNAPSTASAVYPDGANPNGTVNLNVSQTTPTHDNYILGRIDDRLSDSDSLFVRYNKDFSNQTVPSFNTAFVQTSSNDYATIGETHIYSPELLGRTNVSFIRPVISGVDQTLAQLGYPNAPQMPVYTFAPGSTTGSNVPGVLTPGTIQSWGGSVTNPKTFVQNSFQESEDIYLTKGRHAVKFGASMNRIQFNERSDNRAQGSYSFANLNGFILGQVNEFDATLPNSVDIRGWRQNVLGLYVQDDINVRPGLTVNVGVRYEPISTPKEVNGLVANIDNLSYSHLYTLTRFQTDIGGPYYVNPSLMNFAPRVGIAWSPFRSGKMSVRAGFGEFDDQLTSQFYLASGTQMEPLYSTAIATEKAFNAATGAVLAFPDAYTSQLALLQGFAGRGEGFEYHVNQPVVYKYSFSIQQQLSAQTTLEVGYSGARGTHIVRGSINEDTSPIVTVNGQQFIAIEQPLLNPNWGSIRERYTDGDSFYNSMVVTFNKRLGHGLNLESDYTFSKSLDDSSTYSGSSDYSNDPIGIHEGTHWYGRSAFDVTQSWANVFGYDLPKMPGNYPHMLGSAINGWNLSGVLKLNSGPPFTPTSTRPSINRLANGTITANNGLTACSTAQIATGCVTSTALNTDGATIDVVGPLSESGSRQSYFNVSSFAWPTSFATNPGLLNVPGEGALVAVGDAGRNIMNFPGLVNLDLAVRKLTPVAKLGEGGQLEFRFEMFNALNHTRLANPGTAIFNSLGQLNAAAGVSIGSQGFARQLQFALRLSF